MERVLHLDFDPQTESWWYGIRWHFFHGRSFEKLEGANLNLDRTQEQDQYTICVCGYSLRIQHKVSIRYLTIMFHGKAQARF